jgi:hypothetical protein
VKIHEVVHHKARFAVDVFIVVGSFVFGLCWIGAVLVIIDRRFFGVVWL